MGSTGSKSSKSSKGIVRLGSLLFLSLLCANLAVAQSLEAGVYLAASQWSEFDGTDRGVGGRLTWKPASLIGVDADLTWYPSDFPSEGIAFSGSRFEGLFGVTLGPQINRIRPFAKAAAGFLRSSEAPESFPCVLIFPPQLNCLMAAGHTMAAYEIGGGVEVSTTGSTFLRIDVTDRILEYPGPTFTRNFEQIDDAFFGHGLRLTFGFAYRFQ